MNQTLFRNRLARECGVTQKKAGDIIKAFTSIIKDELIHGEDLTLKNFGRFYTTEYNRNSIITPEGKVMELKSHRVVRFKPAEALKNALINGD